MYTTYGRNKRYYRGGRDERGLVDVGMIGIVANKGLSMFCAL